MGGRLSLKFVLTDYIETSSNKIQGLGDERYALELSSSTYLTTATYASSVDSISKKEILQ